MIKIEFKDIIKAETDLKRIGKTIAEIIKEPRFLAATGELLVARAKTNLEEGAADGSSYDLLKPSTKRQKSRGGYSMKPLQRTGQMKRSINKNVQGSKLMLGGVDIIKHHHYGAPRAGVPTRPIFTINNEDYEDVKDITIDLINKTL